MITHKFSSLFSELIASIFPVISHKFAMNIVALIKLQYICVMIADSSLIVILGVKFPSATEIVYVVYVRRTRNSMFLVYTRNARAFVVLISSFLVFYLLQHSSYSTKQHALDKFYNMLYYITFIASEKRLSSLYQTTEIF